MKTNLFAAAVGLSLLGVITISATGENAEPIPNQQAALQAQKPYAPAVVTAGTGPTNIPFAFYLAVVTAFTNGRSIDFDLQSGEGQSILWNEQPEWAKGQ